MDLLRNAIDSIVLGLQDYESKDDRRALSAARNLHAGVLLLFKEKLRQISPRGSNDVLVMERIVPTLDPTGTVVFKGEGKRTVDQQKIQERLSALEVQVDWRRVERLGRLRNDIEHHHPKDGLEVIRSALSDTCVIIHHFMQTHLHLDPAVELGVAWPTLLRIAEVFEADRKHCREALDRASWGAEALRAAVLDLSCASCGKLLLVPSGDAARENPELVCRACGRTEMAESYAERALEAHLALESYVAIKSGGEEPLGICPECGHATYLDEEDVCALCGESSRRNCSRCGAPIPMSELDEHPFCGWCAHMMTRSD